ncbi:R3H domain-containing nucleic acid-binding protein, partial [Chloroflexota bacterium]
GIQSVTLGDEEAKRRGTKKSILERKAPPTFDIVVEIQDRDRVAIHPDVGEAIDSILRGQSMPSEIRWLDDKGEVRIETVVPATEKTGKGKRRDKPDKPPRLYLYGVNRGRLEQIAKERQLKVETVNSLNKASLFVTSKSYYRQKLPKIREAETANLPIYVLKSSTPLQIRQLLNTVYPAENTSQADRFQIALSEAEEAINKVRDGQEAVELSPQSAYIRRLQHLTAEKNALSSQSTGKDPNRRVRIYKEE